MCRKPSGVPRSENKIVTWCSDSGDSDQKSHIIVGDFRFVCGSRFCVWMKSLNLIPSRMKNVGVFLPTALSSFAVVYFVISAFVQVKCPKAPEPLACTTRSGILSRLKCAIFSNSRKYSKTTGPRGPTVSEFWLSPTGRPASVVMIFFFSSAMLPPQFDCSGRAQRGPCHLTSSVRERGLYFQYIVRIRWIGIAYGTSPTSLLLRGG